MATLTTATAPAVPARSASCSRARAKRWEAPSRGRQPHFRQHRGGRRGQPVQYGGQSHSGQLIGTIRGRRRRGNSYVGVLVTTGGFGAQIVGDTIAFNGALGGPDGPATGAGVRLDADAGNGNLISA